MNILHFWFATPLESSRARLTLCAGVEIAHDIMEECKFKDVVESRWEVLDPKNHKNHKNIDSVSVFKTHCVPL